MEFAKVVVHGDGTVEVPIGTQSSGQGHETVFPQVVAEILGVSEEAVSIVTGDLDEVPVGRIIPTVHAVGGIVRQEAAQKAIETAREQAADILEAALEDVSFSQGVFRVSGTDRSVGLFDVAARAENGMIAADHLFRGRFLWAYPNGAAVSEVEIDPGTGHLTVVAHTTIDDPGQAINPMILTGQAHGSIVQGIGQAIIENGNMTPTRDN